MGTRCSADYQRPKLGISGYTHAELNTANMLVGVLHGKAEKTALGEVFLVLLHQKTAGINDCSLTPKLLHRRLMAALRHGQLCKWVTSLLVHYRNVYRAALNGEGFKHLLYIVTVNRLNGVDTVITNHFPSFFAGKVQTARTQCIHDYSASFRMVREMVSERFGSFLQQTLEPLVPHMLHERYNGFFRIEEGWQPRTIELITRLHDRALPKPAGKDIQSRALCSLHYRIGNLQAVFCQAGCVQHKHVGYFGILGQNFYRLAIKLRRCVVVKVDRVFACPVSRQKLGQSANAGF